MSDYRKHLPTVSSWTKAFEKARELGYDAEVRLPKRLAARPLPDRFERSPFPFSISKGATRVYREPKPREHFQVREFEDCWTVDLDQYHPRRFPGLHATSDATTYTAQAVLVGLAGAIVYTQG